MVNIHSPLSSKLRYFFSLGSLSNFVYLFYAAFILAIDFGASVDTFSFLTSARNQTSAALGLAQLGTDDFYADIEEDAYTQALARTNRLYVAAAAVHLVSALLYSLVWPLGGAKDPATGQPWSFFAWVQYPELFNIAEASLVQYTTSMYSKEKVTGVGRYLDWVTLTNHKIELAAALLQLCAAVGWCHVFWRTHERGPGRGLTLDDPELIALIFVALPSILYIAYFASVVANPLNFRNFRENKVINAVFESGDVFYFVGAFFYAVTSFRDSGFIASLGWLAWLRACFPAHCGGKEAPAQMQPSPAALELRAAQAPAPRAHCREEPHTGQGRQEPPPPP